jgi:tetratricopeptide (TPR) repeat protein
MRNIVLITFLLVSTFAFGQKKKNKQTKKATQVETYKKVYAMALENGDATVALNSLYFIIAEEGNNSPYKDSLAFLYFDMGSFTQCEKVAGEIVRDNAAAIEKKERLTMLEILALSQASLGKTKEAIGSFERLLSKTNEMYHAYRLAELQFNYKRIGEAFQSITLAETLTNSMQAPVRIDMGNNQIQEVKLEAAIQNLKGYIILQEYPERKAEAITAFAKALEIQPGFLLAKNNLAFANSKEKKEEKPAEKK